MTFQANSFFSGDHQERFGAAAKLYYFGGNVVHVCGAKNRKGSVCKGVPLRGYHRCIRHCGSKAANLYRERQYKAYLRGSVPANVWFAAEAKRARNRLQDKWKKNAWIVGQTIDLGAHEEVFSASLAERRLDLQNFAPRVLDWLRWKFRRLQIDRRDNLSWAKTLTFDLADRINAAGPKPADEKLCVGIFPAGGIAVRSKSSAYAFSKRARPNVPKAPKQKPAFKLTKRGRPRLRPQSAEEEQHLAEVAFQHRALLQSLYARCNTEEEKSKVLQALADFDKSPDHRGTGARWRTIVSRLRS